MERVCFILRVKTEYLQEYRVRHRAVWPELLEEMGRAGWRNYSLFLGEDGLLVGYLETDGFAAALARVAGSAVNARWQLEMAPFFEGGARPDGSLLRLEEVFHFHPQPAQPESL